MTQRSVTPDPPFTGWEDAAEEAVYRKSVDACLNSPQMGRRLEARPTVTAEAVRSAMHLNANVERALGRCRDSHAAYRSVKQVVAEARWALAGARADAVLDLRSLCAWFCLLASLTTVGWIALFSTLPTELEALAALGVGALLVPLALWVWSSVPARLNLLAQTFVLAGLVGTPVLAVLLRVMAGQWAYDLQNNGTRPVMLLVTEALLGDDPHSVLLPENYDGLRSSHGAEYVVPAAAARELEHKLSLLSGGTIALCGPRGVGKTTLLDGCVREHDFAVRVAVPAAYTPYDFVLAVCIRTCEDWIRRAGYEVPQLARLSGWVRLRRRAGDAVRSLRRRLFFAVPAAALVVLGSAAAARSAWDRHRAALGSWTETLRHWSDGQIQAVWHGERVGVGLLVTCAGLFLWHLRTSERWRHRLRAVPGLLLLLAGLVLLAGPFVSLGFDPAVRDHVAALRPQFVLGEVFLLLLTALFGLVRSLGIEVEIQGHRIRVHRFALAAALGCAALAGFLLLRNQHSYALLVEGGNPVRLASFVVGLLLLRLSRWRTRAAEPALVRQCRDQLYQLRTVQSTSAALTLGVAQMASPAGAHMSALSSVPPSFPQLVDGFRAVMTGIAVQTHMQGGRTLVCIDELDRLGSDLQALGFLSEVKAILGVPRVHYLISVAEDVGAAFVRRGMPHRDATDSSLDDVVHVRPGDLEESTAIMDRRAPGLTRPYVLLAHALSGGVPRDLIRYGRRIMELHESTRAVELADISCLIVVEELSDTLAGFRALLAKQPLTALNADVLTGCRNLMEHLRHTCPHRTEGLLRTLEVFAALGSSGTSGAPPLPEAARQLIDEASAYVYFALTLLQVFTPPAFEQRSTAALNGSPDGHPQVLAEARLELIVSPHSTRILIDTVRRAWGLPALTAPAPPVSVIPAPRRGQRCAVAGCARSRYS
jgi:hypothetical protein